MKFLPFFLLFLLSCGQDEIDCALKGENCKRDNPEAPPGEMVTDIQKQQLRAMKNAIRPWALTCEKGIACGEQDDKSLDSGDSMLWGGLLCSSGGEVAQCTATVLSQTSNGQLFRNPGLSRGKNDSSRDMLLGFLCYLTASRNHTAAKRLIKYLRDNDYKLCDNATDNRCNVGRIQHTAIWGTMKRVWSHIGLAPTWEMEQGDLQGDESIIKLQSKFSAEGFPLHLVGVELMLRQATNSYSNKLAEAADALRSRQPDNPFFEYIAKGKTRRAAQLVLDKCPTTLNHIRKQWAWQRAESEKAWLQSKGWDCIYMANLLLK